MSEVGSITITLKDRAEDFDYLQYKKILDDLITKFLPDGPVELDGEGATYRIDIERRTIETKWINTSGYEDETKKLIDISFTILLWRHEWYWECLFNDLILEAEAPFEWDFSDGYGNGARGRQFNRWNDKNREERRIEFLTNGGFVTHNHDDREYLEVKEEDLVGFDSTDLLAYTFKFDDVQDVARAREKEENERKALEPPSNEPSKPPANRSVLQELRKRARAKQESDG